MTFTKLFSSITESTIWCEESDIRIVWITMLAMANKNGCVFGSAPGLANRARVPVETTRLALRKFQEPDPDSRTKDFEGRRIEEIDGGWKLLNYQKHRAIRHEEERREYMRDLMRKRRHPDVSNVSRSEPDLSHSLSQAEAEADAEAVKSKSLARSARKATRIPEDFIPKEEHYELGKQLGIIVDMEFQKFRDYWLGMAGARAVKRDWDATLRNWLRNSINYGGSNGGRKFDTQTERTLRNREILNRFHPANHRPVSRSGGERLHEDLDRGGGPTLDGIPNLLLKSGN